MSARGPLCTYYSFQFSVFMGFLGAWIIGGSVLCDLFWAYFLCLLVLSNLIVIMFIFSYYSLFLFYYSYKSVCFLMGSMEWIQKWTGTRRSRGRRKHNQDKLYEEKKIFPVKGILQKSINKEKKSWPAEIINMTQNTFQFCPGNVLLKMEQISKS